MLISKVKGFEGECNPTWLNTNEIYKRTNRGYYTGFFKLVKPFLWFKIKYGEEFHGMIIGNTVVSTVGRIS